MSDRAPAENVLEAILYNCQQYKEKTALHWVNEDGDVDIDEFSSLQLPFGDHQTVFDNIDADNNGIITEEEFKNHKPPRPPRK